MPPLRQQKKHKKWLNLYRQYFGIHKPYAVLCMTIIGLVLSLSRDATALLCLLLNCLRLRASSVEPTFLKEARRRKLAIKDHLQRVFLQTSFPGALASHAT